MSRALSVMLDKMPELGWSKMYVTALESFFTQLLVHKCLNDSHGEQVLLRYQARARRDWHEALRRLSTEGGKVYDISILSQKLLESIEAEVILERADLREAQVCSTILPPSEETTIAHAF